ncbi:hypothetical protein GCM10027570_07130 [Streptomonospora sediminis]
MSGSRTEPRQTHTAKLGTAVVGAAVLVILSWTMIRTDYLEPREVLANGVEGTFTLDSCTRTGGTNSGSTTICTGTFRSADGGTEVSDIELSEKHDAGGLDSGASFPARARLGGGPDAVYRDDGFGHRNVLEKGIGSAGVGVIGLMVAGLGALGVWRSEGTARRVVKRMLVAGILAGVVMWIGGLTAGGGLLT